MHSLTVVTRRFSRILAQITRFPLQRIRVYHSISSVHTVSYPIKYNMVQIQQQHLTFSSLFKNLSRHVVKTEDVDLFQSWKRIKVNEVVVWETVCYLHIHSGRVIQKIREVLLPNDQRCQAWQHLRRVRPELCTGLVPLAEEPDRWISDGLIKPLKWVSPKLIRKRLKVLSFGSPPSIPFYASCIFVWNSWPSLT